MNPEVDILARISRRDHEMSHSTARDDGEIELHHQPAARFRFYTDAEIEMLEPPEWLWDGAIPERSLIEIHAPPESAKSFFILGLALSIGTGRPYLGRRVKAGRALIVAAEGSAGLGKRTGAWKHHEEFYSSTAVHFLTEPLTLLHRPDVALFIDAVKRIGPDLRLIVLDTLALCLAGGDENSAKDVGQAISAMHAIRKQTGATVAVIHHVNAAGERERGSTALRGAMDTMLELKREGSRITLLCSKQKDAAKFSPIVLDFVPVEDSMVLVAATNDMTVGALVPGSPTLAVLRTLSESALDDGLSTSAWLKASELKERTFYRCRRRLVIEDLVELVGKRGYGLTKKGRDVVSANCHIGDTQVPRTMVPLAAASPPLLERAATGSGTEIANVGPLHD